MFGFNNNKKVLLSGVQSSGTLHIGNYFGAMKQFVEYQNEYTCYIFVADLHALTTVQDAEKMRRLILDTVAGYLAIGLDSKKVVLFKQSDIPQHPQLAWIFETLTTMPYLMRAHAFKDAEAKNKEINVGVFNYPMLMAADILLYQPDIVPVGKDQEQHIEIARDTADKFNHTYGEIFKQPKGLILDNVKVIPGIDGRKMSKSYGNIIPLFGTNDELRDAVMSVKTDSKGVEEPKDPETDLVFSYHKLFSSGMLEDLETRYRNGGLGYKESKEILLENIEKFVKPLREKRKEILNDKEMILSVLKDGAKRAEERAENTMRLVRDKIGVTLN